MAAKPTLAQVAIGAKATASNWNNGPYRAWQFADVTRPVCMLVQGVSSSCANTTFSALTFDSETVDIDGQHSTSVNTSRVTIGTTLGWYRCSGIVAWNASTLGQRRGAALLSNGVAVNGTETFYTNNTGSSQFLSAVLTPVMVQATLSTDYVELGGYQDTGGALSTIVSGAYRSSFTVEYVGTLQ